MVHFLPSIMLTMLILVQGKDMFTSQVQVILSQIVIKIQALRGNLTGRSQTGVVDILTLGVAFANGVVVDVDEAFVLYTWTFDASIRKYHLDGSGEEWVQGVFPGVVDGADCSFQTGLCSPSYSLQPPSL